MLRDIDRLKEWPDKICMNSTIALLFSALGPVNQLETDWLGSCSDVERTRGPQGQQAKHELAVCLDNEEGLQYTRLYLQQRSQ